MKVPPNFLRDAVRKGLVSPDQVAANPAADGRKERAERSLVDATWRIEVTLRVSVRGEALNAREHWAARHRRVKAERKAVAAELESLFGKPGFAWYDTGGHIRIHLTLIGGRNRIDDDNVEGRLKAVRDEIADWIGIDDGDARLKWEYGHERGERDGVRMQIEGGAP